MSEPQKEVLVRVVETKAEEIFKKEYMIDQDFFIPLTMQFGFSQKKTIGYLWETLECTVSVMKMVAEGIDKNSE